MLRHLAFIARDAGISGLHAHTLPDNRRALRVLHRESSVGVVAEPFTETADLAMTDEMMTLRALLEKSSDACPRTPMRYVPRDLHEDARDVARALAKTEAFEQSRRSRKRVEMLFAHLKRILRLGRLRLRGPRGVPRSRRRRTSPPAKLTSSLCMSCVVGYLNPRAIDLAPQRGDDWRPRQNHAPPAHRRNRRLPQQKICQKPTSLSV